MVKNKKVFVGMSGGVDSSVAAALLKKRGYEVIGVHLKCYNVDGCAEQDSEDARRAAEVLGIPFYVFDFEKEYKEKVVEYMVDGYRQGITPNPDVMCNKEIKFGLFLKKALDMGADYVATGHYVRSGVAELPARTAVRSLQRRAPATSRFEKSPMATPIFSKLRSFSTATRQHLRYLLFAAKDLNKDQSYFLWTLAQNQLRHCLFPIGDYIKPEVRKLAKKFGLPNADKKDSQGICFLGQITLKDFLGNYLPEKRGIVLNTAGKVVGEHSGAHFYTIGQRHLSVKYQVSGVGQKPVYVAEKDVKENAILVAEESDPALYKKEIELKNINFINSITQLLNYPISVYVRVRYRQPLVKAILAKSNKRQATWKLKFNQPIKFVAQGQSAVFYSVRRSFTKRDWGYEMLGGGVIA